MEPTKSMEFFLIYLCSLIMTMMAESHPNVIIFLTDDWGFNDVGYNNNTDTETPFLDDLATTESLILNYYFTYSQCSPSRAALLTGRYPLRYGMQEVALGDGCPTALSTSETLLSSKFQDAGYNTYIIGKWHVGYCSWDYTPTYRGFDEFYGYYGAQIDYYNYERNCSFETGYDLRVNEDACNISSLNQQYSLFWQRDHVLQTFTTISEDKNESPFFMFVPWQASHPPKEAPTKYLSLYGTIEPGYDDTQPFSNSRAAFQAQTTALDDVMDTVITDLKAKNLWDNTLIIFASDNGADANSGDNFPLRGTKKTLWNGGLLVPAFVTGGALPEDRRGTYLDETIHVIDLFPTVLSAAGIDYEDIALDGINAWQTIKDGITTDAQDDRSIVFYINPYECDLDVCGAIYWKNFKLIYSDLGMNADSDTATCYWNYKYALNTSYSVLGCTGIQNDSNIPCNCSTTPCLFDLSTDVCEMTNVYDDYPYVAKYLFSLLRAYGEAQFSSLSEYCVINWTQSSPTLFDNFWAPFKTNSEDLDFEIALESWKSSGSSNEKETSYWTTAQSYKAKAIQEILGSEDQNIISINFMTLMKNIYSHNIIFGITIIILGIMAIYFICNRKMKKGYEYIMLQNDINEKTNAIMQHTYGSTENA